MYLFLLFCVVRLFNAAATQALSPAFERVPTAENFWRKAFHACTLAKSEERKPEAILTAA